MVSVQRGEIWWADLPAPRGSEPAYRRPVLIIQDDAFNASRLSTVLAAVITTNLDLARLRANVFLPATDTGLPKDSAVNLTQILTVDKAFLLEFSGTIPPHLQGKVHQGLRLILAL